MAKKTNKWLYALVVIVCLTILSFLAASFISLIIGGDFESIDGNVAVIEITGPIVAQSSNGFGFSDITSADDVVKLVRKAERSDRVKAIIFEINSPGGSAVASDEIASEIKDVNKTTVAWIREAGASGAYWIASSTDHVIANRMSITGSIGVIASYLGFSEFIEENNVTYQRLVAGRLKDMGSPFKELTQEERFKFQESLDLLHDFFIEEVAANRNLSREEVERIATGEFFIGVEAKELGLVDELGSRDEVRAYVEEEIGEEVDLIRYKTDRGIFGSFGSAMNEKFFYVGRGIGNSFLAQSEKPQTITITT